MGHLVNFPGRQLKMKNPTKTKPPRRKSLFSQSLIKLWNPLLTDTVGAERLRSSRSEQRKLLGE